MPKNFCGLRGEHYKWTPDPDSVPFWEISMTKMHFPLVVLSPNKKKGHVIFQLLKQDRHVSCNEIAEALVIIPPTVWYHLNKVSFSEKLVVFWMAHKLMQRYWIDWIKIELKDEKVKLFLTAFIIRIWNESKPASKPMILHKHPQSSEEEFKTEAHPESWSCDQCLEYTEFMERTPLQPGKLQLTSKMMNL